MIFYIIPEIRYALGLAELAPEPMTIITGHKHPAIEYLRAQKIEVWCAEEKKKETSFHAPGLLRLSAVQKMIEECPQKKRKLLTFKVSPPFSALAQKLEAEVLMPAYKLNRFWEDKSKASAALAEAKLPVKASITATWGSLNYAKATKALKTKKLVVQKPHGMAGNSTYFVNNVKEWGKLKSVIGSNPLVKVSPYLDGEPCTVNCLLSAKGSVLSSYPMLQITGDSRFTRYVGGTCGVDMTGGEQFKKPFLTKLEKAIEKMAILMHKQGFWGWFGVDFLVDKKGDFVILEINPRFTATVSIFTQAQHLNLKNSFWELYLSGKESKADFVKPLPYTSLLIRNVNVNEVTLQAELTTGVYTLEKDKLKLKKESVFLKDLATENEYLIITKGKKSLVHPDAEMATIVAYGSATKNGEVNKDLAKVADLVKIALLNN